MRAERGIEEEAPDKFLRHTRDPEFVTTRHSLEWADGLEEKVIERSVVNRFEVHLMLVDFDGGAIAVRIERRAEEEKCRAEMR